MNGILCQQIAVDYCCSPEDVSDHDNHFTEHRFLERRRRFQEGKECFLKLAVINGKLLFTGNKDMIEWCRGMYDTSGAEWFLEAKNLHILNKKLHEEGYQIETVHPFFISETLTDVCADNYELQWYHDEEIEQFRGDGRYDKAFAFCEDAPDVVGVAAVRDGKILGMAGASCDSPVMWQIGINVNPEAGGSGIGKMLVSLLKNDILKRGILPYYGTSMSHFASQRVALGAGFFPAWAELVTSRITE